MPGGNWYPPGLRLLIHLPAGSCILCPCLCLGYRARPVSLPGHLDVSELTHRCLPCFVLSSNGMSSLLAPCEWHGDEAASWAPAAQNAVTCCFGHFCSENERQVPEKAVTQLPGRPQTVTLHSRSDQKHWPQRGHLPGPGPAFLHPHLIQGCSTRITTQATIFSGILLLKRGLRRSNPILSHSSPLVT